MAARRNNNIDHRIAELVQIIENLPKQERNAIKSQPTEFLHRIAELVIESGNSNTVEKFIQTTRGARGGSLKGITQLITLLCMSPEHNSIDDLNGILELRETDTTVNFSQCLIMCNNIERNPLEDGLNSIYRQKLDIILNNSDYRDAEIQDNNVLLVRSINYGVRYPTYFFTRPPVNININSTTHKGMTPLMFAASRGDIHLVGQVLQAGANIDVQDNDGNTALMYAARTGNPDLVRQLLQAGAEIDIQDRMGKTALMYAAQMNNVTVVTLLIEEGANQNISNSQGHKIKYYMDMGRRRRGGKHNTQKYRKSKHKLHRKYSKQSRRVTKRYH